MTGMGEASTVVLEQSTATVMSAMMTAWVELPVAQVVASTIEWTEERRLVEDAFAAATGQTAITATSTAATVQTEASIA
jgi:hypothetical protein